MYVLLYIYIHTHTHLCVYRYVDTDIDSTRLLKEYRKYSWTLK